MKKKEDVAKSISSRLSQIAKTRKANFSDVFTEFLIERLVVRLESNSKTSGSLLYKGGYVSLKVYESPRYTIDLDALLKNGSLESIIKSATEAGESDIGDCVWFRSVGSKDLKTQGEYGFSTSGYIAPCDAYFI